MNKLWASLQLLKINRNVNTCSIISLGGLHEFIFFMSSYQVVPIHRKIFVRTFHTFFSGFDSM